MVVFSGETSRHWLARPSAAAAATAIAVMKVVADVILTFWRSLGASRALIDIDVRQNPIYKVKLRVAF